MRAVFKSSQPASRFFSKAYHVGFHQLTNHTTICHPTDKIKFSKLCHIVRFQPTDQPYHLTIQHPVILQTVNHEGCLQKQPTSPPTSLRKIFKSMSWRFQPTGQPYNTLPSHSLNLEGYLQKQPTSLKKIFKNMSCRFQPTNQPYHLGKPYEKCFWKFSSSWLVGRWAAFE